MHISGIEPSSVILGQRKYLNNLQRDAPKVSNQVEAKRVGVINPQNYNFNSFEVRKISMLSKFYQYTEINLAICALKDSLVHQQWHSQSSWNI